MVYLGCGYPCGYDCNGACFTLMVSHPDTGQSIPLISLWEAEGNPDLSWISVRDRYLYRGWSVKEAITKPKRGQT